MTAHVSRRGSLESRFRVNVILVARGWLRQRLVTWAADPRTTTKRLESALDEVLNNEPRTEWDAFVLKVGYLEIMSSLEPRVDPISQ
jgi:hypothetical protein